VNANIHPTYQAVCFSLMVHIDVTEDLLLQSAKTKVNVRLWLCTRGCHRQPLEPTLCGVIQTTEISCACCVCRVYIHFIHHYCKQKIQSFLSASLSRWHVNYTNL